VKREDEREVDKTKRMRVAEERSAPLGLGVGGIPVSHGPHDSFAV